MSEKTLSRIFIVLLIAAVIVTTFSERSVRAQQAKARAIVQEHMGSPGTEYEICTASGWATLQDCLSERNYNSEGKLIYRRVRFTTSRIDVPHGEIPVTSTTGNIMIDGKDSPEGFVYFKHGKEND